MDKKLNLESRLKTVQTVLLWLTKEVGDLRALVGDKPSTDVAVPHSAASAVGVDLQAIIDQADALQAPQENLASAAVKKMFLGADSLLVRYLDAKSIVGGKGSLAPGSLLRQYDEDIWPATAARLLMWPSGFYRDAVTKDTQLLLKAPSRHLLLCINGLPGNTPVVKLHEYVVEQGSYREYTMQACVELTEAEASVFTQAANACLQDLLATFVHEQHRSIAA